MNEGDRIARLEERVSRLEEALSRAAGKQGSGGTWRGARDGLVIRSEANAAEEWPGS